MMMLKNRLALCAGATGLLALACSIAAAEPTMVVPSPSVQHDVTRYLSVSDFALERTRVDGRLGEQLKIEINLEGVNHAFSLSPFSLRSPNFKAMAQVEGGKIVEIEAPAPRTYRGVSDDGALTIVGSLLDNGFRGQILEHAEKGHAWGIQPLDDVVPGSDADLYLVFSTADEMPTGQSCGGAVLGDDLDAFDHHVEIGASGTRGQLLACEIIIDADYNFYANDNGSNEAATIADIENVMAGVDTVYMRDVNVTFILNQILVRTDSGSNPYTTNDPDTLLTQVRNAWVGTGADRDLVHMFTGRNITGSVIGIAYLSGACSNNQGYGLSESKFTFSINSRIALTAHEIGHNFSAQHCSGGACYIMCAGLGGCGGISPPGVTGAGFGTTAKNSISNFAASHGCIEPAGPPFLEWPFFQDFASTTIDTDVWQGGSGALINTGAVGEPSAPNSLNLDFADTIETGRFNLGDDVGQPLHISLYTEHRSVESGESLFLEYQNIASSWINIATFTSDGVTQDSFDYHEVPIPTLAFWSEVKFRLRASGNQGDDDWYIDDFSIAPYAGITPPFEDDFESGLDLTFVYASNAGGIISTAADNEPSGSNSLNLDNADSITTFNVKMSGLFGTADYYVHYYTQHKGVESGETLTVQFKTLGGTWLPLETVTSDGVNQTEFDLHQILVPVTGYTNEFAVRFIANGNESNDDWYIDNLAVTTDFIEDEPTGCNAADLAEPFDVLDFSDVVSYLTAFATCEAEADLAAPFGSCDFSDVVAFLSAFGGGCP
ncbi:MAG: M12 family metallo-peptidase [Phycisphaerales bacterium]